MIPRKFVLGTVVAIALVGGTVAPSAAAAVAKWSDKKLGQQLIRVVGPELKAGQNVTITEVRTAAKGLATLELHATGASKRLIVKAQLGEAAIAANWPNNEYNLSYTAGKAIEAAAIHFGVGGTLLQFIQQGLATTETTATASRMPNFVAT